MVKYIINLSTAAVFAVLSRLISVFCRVKNNKVIFISDVRAELGGNFLSVYRYLPDSDYEKALYLKADRREFSSLGKWIRFVYDMTTSGTILLEDYFRYTSYYKVRKNQQLCQLWHAAGAFKKFGYSRLSDGEGIRIHKGYKKYSKAITSSDAIIPNYAEAFGIAEEKVRATGIPRTDIFFDSENALRVRKRMIEKYPQMKGKKVILFAPTYRGTRAEDAGYDLEQLDLDSLYRELNEEYFFIFKWHPAMYNNIIRNKAYSFNTEKYNDFFLDLSSEKDIEEIMLISDILITDYSSVIFDYYLLDRPVVFFAYDYELYADGRGWYYPFDEYIYGPLTGNQEELIQAIKEMKTDTVKRSVFGKKFMDACDGHSTEKTCEWIFGVKES